MNNLIIYSTQHNKIRIGKPNDGGYVICDISNTYDCLISGGISNDISFEQAILNRYGPMPCYAFDGTINHLPVEDTRIEFIKKNLGNKESSSVTNLHLTIEPYSNIFMKIDIEGHEFRLFPTFSDQQMNKIAQLVLEVHSPGDIHLHPTYFEGLSDITHSVMIEFLEKINKTHTLVHLHPNNGCDTYFEGGVYLPNVYECTFIRNDFISTKTPNTTPLPFPIDMPNVKQKPIIVFDKYPFVCKLQQH